MLKPRRFLRSLLLGSLLGGIFFTVSIAEAATSSNQRQSDVKIFDGAKTTLKGSFLAFDKAFQGGGTVAIGDTNGDGTNEIVVGAGPGGGPEVRVFTHEGEKLASFDAYQRGFGYGVKVAACDLDHDGSAEIVTGTGQGGAPMVRTFSGTGDLKFTPGFFPFAQTFRGGVNIACGDVNGDGANDIVVGVGNGAPPKVKVFDRYGKSLNLDITPYAQRDKGGVSVAVANVDGGKESEIVTGIYRFGRSQFKVYKTDSIRTIKATFDGWVEEIQGGFNVAAGDLNGNGVDDLVAAIGVGNGPQVRTFHYKGNPMSQNFFAYEQSFRGGVNIAVGDVDGDGKPEIVTMPGKNTVQGSPKYQKYVEVVLKEQRLYAYENGYLVRTFLVSTGIDKYPTPEGIFSVTAKVPIKDYEWSYGPDHPDNYDIKDVKWNLRFAPTYYLHYAFWHNSFGKKRSHGCVNINKVNSEWIYNWANVGMPVVIHQ